MIRLTRSMAGPAGLVGVCALLVVGAGGSAAQASAGKPTLHRGRADSGIAYLAITRSQSVQLEYAAGEDQDKVLGTGASTYTIKAVISKTGIHLTVKPVVFYTANGSLTGTATGTATVKATGETIKGTLSLTRGRGGQKGHSLVGSFSAQSDSTFKFLTLTYYGLYR